MNVDAEEFAALDREHELILDVQTYPADAEFWPMASFLGYVVGRLDAAGRHADAEWLAERLERFHGADGAELERKEGVALHRRNALKRAGITAVIDGGEHRELAQLHANLPPERDA